MSNHVFVISEWLPKKEYEEEVWKAFKKLMATTAEKETGCVRSHAFRQISDPNAPGKSKFTIVLFQEYENREAFDIHCKADYVTDAFQKYVETSMIEEWSVRLFSDN